RGLGTTGEPVLRRAQRVGESAIPDGRELAEQALDVAEMRHARRVRDVRLARDRAHAETCDAIAPQDALGRGGHGLRDVAAVVWLGALHAAPFAFAVYAAAPASAAIVIAVPAATGSPASIARSATTITANAATHTIASAYILRTNAGRVHTRVGTCSRAYASV